MRLYAVGSASAVRQTIDNGFLARPMTTLDFTRGRSEWRLLPFPLEFAVEVPRLHFNMAVLPGSLDFVMSLDIPKGDLGEENTRYIYYGEEVRPVGMYYVSASVANKYLHTLKVWQGNEEVPPELVGK